MFSIAKKSTLFLTLLLFSISGVTAGESHNKTTFESLTENYLAIQTSLAGDSLQGVAANAAVITKSAADLAADFNVHQAGINAADSESLIQLLPDLQKAASALSKAKTIDAAGSAFGPLSGVMVSYRNLAIGEVPQVAYCPMAKQSWLQNGKQIANPYYGSMMLRCGSIVE